MFKKRIVSGIFVCVFVISLIAGCAPGGGSDTSQSATLLPPIKADSRIIAEGKVLPRRYATLSMLTSGIVAEVLVQEGDTIAEGQPMIRLQNSSQRAAVSEAEAAVRAAEARLEELKAGARAQEIEAAEAQVDAAEARLARLVEDPRSSDLAAAQASLDEAEASLEDLVDGPSADELAQVAAQRANAAAALQQAQAAYDEVKWFDSVGQLPQSLKLQQATNDYEAANASYEALIDGPTDAEIAAAQARVRRAEAELAQVRQSARASEIAEAEAEVRRTQANLDLLKAGTRTEQVAKAEADVIAAYATLRRTQAALGDTELRAPFAGTVAWLNTRAGELIDPSRPVVELADLSSWIIETDDLTEIEVVDVQIGAPVTITFDAIQDLELPGHVKWITPYGERKEGDITYTVRVCPDEEDRRLRWNMTAIVSIEPMDSPPEKQPTECPTSDGSMPEAPAQATVGSSPATATVAATSPVPTSTPNVPSSPAPTSTPTIEKEVAMTATTMPSATSLRSIAVTVTIVPPVTPTPTVSAPTAEITSIRLNVRSGPGTDYSILGSLRRGQVVDILARDPETGWLQINFPGAPDGTAWITNLEPYVKINE